VNPKITSNQSSKPCTVLQYPSTKVRKRRDRARENGKEEGRQRERDRKKHGGRERKRERQREKERENAIETHTQTYGEREKARESKWQRWRGRVGREGKRELKSISLYVRERARESGSEQAKG